MTGSPLDDYLRELERALQTRGHVSTRTVDEAREHLAGTVEDGVRRGLTREDAEREAWATGRRTSGGGLPLKSARCPVNSA